MRILVTGARGLIGLALSAFLEHEGHKVVALVRAKDDQRAPSWDPEAGRLKLDGSYEAVVHLAGESVASRWTPAKKRRIYASRVEGTRLLSEGLARLNPPPRVLLCASAVGYYGDRGEEWVTESSEPGDTFLAETVKAWEKAAEPARAAGVRVVHLRFGIVLTPQGGALAKLLTPFRLGLGGRMGDGRQYWSWVALDDLLNVIRHSLQAANLEGPVNVVAPHPVSNAEFAQTLAAVFHRPALMPVPSFAIRMLLGQMGEEMLLGSCRVRPARLLDSGFNFAYPELPGALRHLLQSRKQKAENRKEKGESRK